MSISLSAEGFVFFFFESEIADVDIPVPSANFAWVISQYFYLKNSNRILKNF